MDMGQADRTLRSQTKPKPFTWFEVKPKAHIVRGDVCVIRRMNGSPEMFKIVEQHSYKEWSGCFSII
jgi:hypothetical protein